VVSADNRSLVYENKKEIVSLLDISDEAYEVCIQGMIKVAHESNGTASSVFRKYPVTIAAKTGTAETGNGSDNGAFVCFAPAEDPEIVVVVYGEKAGHGKTLASVAKQILDVYFEIGDSADVDSSENQVS
jgi:penicillin-binding protein 2